MSRRLITFAVLLVVLTVTGTGVVTAFASSSENHSGTEEARIVVVPGDTLWEIAVDHKPRGKDTRVYVEAIKRFNGLTTSDIKAGDTLILPD
ncbi:LysM peptidoglycan-binding domain-containing protein [Paenibacillus sp. M1]|uniref:LysM peptidoglycan-binding domain-containing protein n=1 Tax=Paenibacillus haidiansis TaxID=1574488 RepID=A0ABU7VU43_9BACL